MSFNNNINNNSNSNYIHDNAHAQQNGTVPAHPNEKHISGIPSLDSGNDDSTATARQGPKLALDHGQDSPLGRETPSHAPISETYAPALDEKHAASANFDGPRASGPPGRGIGPQLVQPLSALRHEKALVDCPRCKQTAWTDVARHAGSKAMLWGGLLCVCVGCCVAWIPCVMTDCKDSEHSCPNCNLSLAMVEAGSSKQAIVTQAAKEYMSNNNNNNDNNNSSYNNNSHNSNNNDNNRGYQQATTGHGGAGNGLGVGDDNGQRQGGHANLDTTTAKPVHLQQLQTAAQYQSPQQAMHHYQQREMEAQPPQY